MSSVEELKAQLQQLGALQSSLAAQASGGDPGVSIGMSNLWALAVGDAAGCRVLFEEKCGALSEAAANAIIDIFSATLAWDTLKELPFAQNSKNQAVMEAFTKLEGANAAAMFAFFMYGCARSQNMRSIFAKDIDKDAVSDRQTSLKFVVAAEATGGMTEKIQAAAAQIQTDMNAKYQISNTGARQPVVGSHMALLCACMCAAVGSGGETMQAFKTIFSKTGTFGLKLKNAIAAKAGNEKKIIAYGMGVIRGSMAQEGAAEMVQYCKIDRNQMRGYAYPGVLSHELLTEIGIGTEMSRYVEFRLTAIGVATNRDDMAARACYYTKKKTPAGSKKIKECLAKCWGNGSTALVCGAEILAMCKE